MHSVVLYMVYTKNGAVSKVNQKFISHLTRAQHTPSAAATVQVSQALVTVLECLHPGSRDTHSYGNQFHPRLGVAHRRPFPAATPSWKLAPRPRSKYENLCNNIYIIKLKLYKLLNLINKTAPFFCVYPVLYNLSH